MNSNTFQKLKFKIPIQCQRMYKNDKQKSNQKKKRQHTKSTKE